jgi:hypothetical protein
MEREMELELDDQRDNGCRFYLNFVLAQYKIGAPLQLKRIFKNNQLKD